MSNDPTAIARALEDLLQPNARRRLRALGLARGIVWRNGEIPAEGPRFPDDLTDELLDFGYCALAMALELRDDNLRNPEPPGFDTREAFTMAAECIESAKRRESLTDNERGRHLVIAASAFHLGGYSARAYSLLSQELEKGNLASVEKALALLLRRDLFQLRHLVTSWFASPENSDEQIAQVLSTGETADLDSAAAKAIYATYFRAIGQLDTSLIYGDIQAYEVCLLLLEETIKYSATLANLPSWWVATLTKHIARDLWTQSLHQVLPLTPGNSNKQWEDLRRDYITLLAARVPPQIDLWPSQLRAAQRAVDISDNLVVALPTSAGKTRIAELCILRTLSDGKRAVYVTPLRALSAQVEYVLARSFVPLGMNVTQLYGAVGETQQDAKTIANADIVVATPEKLDFALRQDPSVLDDVGLIVFDEGHMIGLSSREIRYEVLVQRLLRREDAGARRIVCLSAMFNPEDEFFEDFGNWLRRDTPGESIHVKWRPTRQLFATLAWEASLKAARLSFLEGEKPFVPRFFEERPAPPKTKGQKGGRKKPFPKDDRELCAAAAEKFAAEQQDVLVYSPQRRQIEPLVSTFVEARELGYLKTLRIPESTDLNVALAIGREWLGIEHPALQGLQIGVAAHHAWLPRPFQAAVEELLRTRKLSVVVASPTLAQGVDLSCSTLIFRSLRRFDPKAKPRARKATAAGQKQRLGAMVPIKGPEFANVVGRAGRAFVDLDGTCVFPMYKAGAPRTWEFKIFENLIEGFKDQRILSGLALLVERVCQELTRLLKVPGDALYEYVLNQRDLWSTKELTAAAKVDAAAEDDEQSLTELLSDLDLALLSLIEQLDTPAESLAKVLDSVLASSLWQRTLTRVNDPALIKLQREVLTSRAEWVWKATTSTQRRACFSAGLGSDAGTFLYNRIDLLAPFLAQLQEAMVKADSDAAIAAAIGFVSSIMQNPFFEPQALPPDWDKPLAWWIEGRPFREILALHDKAAGFIRDGAGFKFVWAAEAIRVQAANAEHALADSLGDGPALAFEYGVPSMSAALLCQSGYASRTGALWVTQQLDATFSDFNGMRNWEHANRKQLADSSFWQNSDQRLLWLGARRSRGGPKPIRWKRTNHVVDVEWHAAPLPQATTARLLRLTGSRFSVCAPTLEQFGEALLQFEVDQAVLEAKVRPDGKLDVTRLGP